MASFSDYWENKVLDATFGDPDVTITAPTYLALCTTVPTDASTGSTIVEATYTGYARKAVAASDMSAAAVGLEDQLGRDHLRRLHGELKLDDHRLGAV